MKKKIVPIIVCITNLLTLALPWIPLGTEKYSYYQFLTIAWSECFEQRIIEAGVYTENITNLMIGTKAELILIGLSALFSIIYIVGVLLGKYWKINLLNVFCLLVVLLMHNASWETLTNFCSVDLLGTFVPSFIFLMAMVEPIASRIINQWDEIKQEVEKNKAIEKAYKSEKKERLYFKGKYTKLFYRVIVKNFKKTGKDFVLLLVCNIILFSFFVVGLGLKRILALENTSKGTLIFNGLNQILVNAMVPMAIVSVFVIIVLLFYYLKCRTRGYGVFLTLGLRRRTLYYFLAIELIGVLLLSIILGSVLGIGILKAFINHSDILIGITLTNTGIGAIPCVQSTAILFLIYVISLLTAKEIFVDFNVGKSTDLRAIAEKMPMRFRKIILGLGVFGVVYCIIQYGRRYNFENKYLLLVLFIILFVVIRYGIVNYLLYERKKRSYIKKLMMHNQLYHKSMTNAGYIAVFTIMQFCILFYFSFQLFSAKIAEDPETLFPYDIVCFADESDNTFFEELNNNYDIKFFEFPMVRVAAYDSTEAVESIVHQGNPVQGVHIGISENTYHELKKLLDSAYRESDLGLSKNGEDIYIVYQQDQSVKAQPTEFYAPRKKPFLHIGLPCRDVNIMQKVDYGYEMYEVCGEEVESLIGVHKQGLRENIIVFSDEYFNKIKDLWKTTDINTGQQIKNEDDRIENLTIFQGVTKIVLMNVKESDLAEVSEKFVEFEKKHLLEEENAYVLTPTPGIYDKSVAYHYEKEESIKNIMTERVMKTIMNPLVMILFIAMNVMLLIIKMLSEIDMDCRRFAFLTCMGMCKKDRIKLIKKEMFRYYYVLPMCLSLTLASIFTFVVFRARIYTEMDVVNYLKYYIPGIFVYLIAATVIAVVLMTMYAYRVEEKKDGRSS